MGKNKYTLTSNRLGTFYAKKISNKNVKVKPFKEDKYPLPILHDIPQMLNDKDRIKYPMVRKSYLENNGPSMNKNRGQEDFIKVSWDVAIKLCAKALKENFDEFGSSAIYGDCNWCGGSGKVGWGRLTAHRMLKVLGGFVEETPDYSTGAGLVIMSHVLGDGFVYGMPTKWQGVLKGAKNIVFWGSNLLETGKIADGAPTHDGYCELKKIKKRSKLGKLKTICIDPLKNETQEYFNSKFISIIPNTDTALMIGICHYLFVNNLYDKKFIKKYTNGFEEFKKYFLGIDDNLPKDVSWASKICGIQKKEIKKLAISLSKKPSLIIAGRSLQRQDHGEQAFWMIVVLSAMLGHIGKTGCGFEFNLGYGASGAKDKIAPKLNYFEGKRKKRKNIFIPTSRIIETLQNPNKTIECNGETLTLPQLKVGYFASGSIFTKHQDVNNIIRNWHKFDTVITADPYFTSQAKMSDILLPVATELERYDLEQTCPTNKYIFIRKPIIKPLGESKSDWWICKRICKEWELEKEFSDFKNELGEIKYLYKDILEQGKKLKIKNLPKFKNFYKKGFIKFTSLNKKTKSYTRLEKYISNPNKYKLATVSGKIEIFSKKIASFGYDDCFGHPKWLEPIEYLGNKTKENPFHLISPHPKHKYNSQFDNSNSSKAWKHNGKEPILLHPQNAKEKGIANGDIVKVYNKRGSVLAYCVITKKIKKNVCAIYEGSWYKPEILGEPSLCYGGCVNVLTIDKGSSKLSQSNISHTCLVNIEKFTKEN